MNDISGYDKWLTTPPDEPPYCEDGCGDTLEKDINGDWSCPNMWCPTKFQGVEKEIAIALLDMIDSSKYWREKYHRAELEILDRDKTSNQWKEMYYKMTNERDELEYKLHLYHE